MSLEKAGTIDELRESLRTFVEALGTKETKFAVFHPGYWVYDPELEGFAPAKWAAYRAMTPERYADLQERQRTARVPGFSGSIARKHIERLTGETFAPNPGLVERLEERFKATFKPEDLGNRNLGDLAFLVLDAARRTDSLHYQVRDELRTAYEKMLSDEEVAGREELERYFALFAERFGPEALLALDGEALLRHMHEHGNQDSLVYWLEFKNDDEFPAIFGSIAGGSALKFGIYRKKETGAWMTGSPHNQAEIPVEEAVAVARRHRDQLVAGVRAIEALPDDAGDDEYARLQATLEDVAPGVQSTAWGHKYFSLFCPGRLDQFHVEDWQQFNLVRLLQVPPATPGRYASAGRFVALARDLGMTVPHLCRALVRRHGAPYRYRRFDVGDGAEGDTRWRAMLADGVVGLEDGEIGDLEQCGSQKDVQKRLEDAYRLSKESAGSRARSLWLLKKYTKTGDVILVSRGSRALAIGKIEEGDCKFAPGSAFPHQRAVTWLDGAEWPIDTSEPLKVNVDRFRSDWRVPVQIERRLLDPTPPVPPDKPKPKPVALDGMPGRIQRVLERKGQLILYGPPGTGKTYWAERAAKEIVATRVYGRPYAELDAKEQGEVFGGANGASGLVRLCSFHPAYGYEDFIEGYRPQTNNDQLSFSVVPGVFWRACADAAEQTDKPFFLIIDEINRGDIPRIFGELLTVLELSKRGMPIVLPLTGATLRVPRNLSVIGTMNTADRSIALLDTALRRRFGFIELMPDPSVLGGAEVGGIPLAKWLAALNRRICEHIGRDARNLQIGHSYLMAGDKPITEFAQFSRLLREDILPLLEEYCYDDWEALHGILGKGFVDPDRQRFADDLFDSGREADLVQAAMAIDPSLATAAEATTSEDEEGEAEEPVDEADENDG